MIILIINNLKWANMKQIYLEKAKINKVLQ